MSVDLLRYLLSENASCYACGKELPTRSKAYLCHDCSGSLPLIEGPVCTRCGRPVEKGALCSECMLMSYHFEGNIACFTYEELGKQLIRTYKYGGRPHLWRPFSELMIDRWYSEERKRVDRVIPVPMHWTRFIRRGFNQTQALARPVADALGVPVDTHLRRVGRTPPLEQLDGSGRAAALTGAFSYDGDLTGERVLLVDDVMTTGTTLNACANVLKRCGAERVITMTLAVQMQDDE